MVPISSVCTVNPRRTRNEHLNDDSPVGFVPMAAVDEDDGSIRAMETRPYASVARGFTSFRPRDVIFAKITPCMENGKAALVGELPNEAGFGSTEFHVLRAGDAILPELVHAWVRRFVFRADARGSFKGTAGQQRVPAEFFDRALIPLPPLEEQRRIVDVLNRAAGIRRLREAALAKARDTIPALFLSMFGDPATNPKGWPVMTVGEVLASAQYGTSRKADSNVDGIPVIRMGNVTFDGYLLTTDLKFVQLPESELGDLRLIPGDVLFNRTNSKELVGKTALWDGRFDAVAASYFIRLRTRPDLANGEFVWAFMNSSFMKRRLFETARGAIGQANMNTKELRAFKLPLPPLALQQQFAARLTDLRGIIAQAERALGLARETERALMAHLLG